MAGPTPLTRWNPSREPKGPSESRSAIIRFARAGPMRGRRSSDSAGALSRSSRVRGIDVVEGFEVREGGSRGILALDPLDPLDPRDSLAESTAAICARSDARAVAAGAWLGRDARWKRTPAPRSVTAEKKQSALRSDGVTRE